MKKVIAIIETGLGGRLDATNVIKGNLCSIITHIDFDHTDRLGDTKEKSAYEKAGIIKPNCPVITSMGYEAIKDKADERDSMMIFVSPFMVLGATISNGIVNTTQIIPSRVK